MVDKCVVSDEKHIDHDFSRLSDEDKLARFKQIIEDSEYPVFVLFHATWCGHCKRFKPILETYNKKCNNKFIIIYVENGQSEIIHKEYKDEVSGFPTLLVFKGGKIVDRMSGNDKERLDELVIKYTN